MKNRLIAYVLAALVVLSAVPFAALAMTQDAYVVTSNGGALNMRIYPQKDSAAVASIPYGGKVVIKGDYNDGTWIDVYYKDKEGYVMRRFLSYDKPAPKPTPKPNPKPTPKPNPNPSVDIATLFKGFEPTCYYVTVRPSTAAGTVNLRWAPTKSAGIMAKYHQDQVLEVISQNKTWAQVRNTELGTVGFMMRSFLTDVAVGAPTSEGAAQQVPTQQPAGDTSATDAPQEGNGG